jgi:hypothetical protein
MLDLTPYRQAITADYPEATIALDHLTHTQDPEATLEHLLQLSSGSPITFSDRPLLPLIKKRLQQEICGDDDSIRSLIQSLKKNPGNAALITGAITTLINLSGFPFPIDPALATGITLYLAHIGIDVFCEWSNPQDSQP